MSDDPVRSEAKKKLKTLWTTQGARFAAHQRMLTMHRWSLGAIALASLYVCTVSALPYAIELSPTDTRLTGVVSIVSAVGILILSLLEAGQKYEVKAGQLHRCGIELGKLRNRYDLFIADDCSGGIEELERLCSKYDEILESCPENHHAVDDARFRASRPNEFDWGFLRACWANATYYAYVYWRFVLIITLPPLIIWLALA